MFKLYSVEGNRQKLDGGSMFGNAPRALWERWFSPDERGRIELACRTLLLVSPEKKILCETGIGAFFSPELAERYGVEEPSSHKLLENLKHLNFDPKEIDFVVLSHLHFDHAGGLFPSYAEMQKGNTELIFPNATYITSKKAFERALTPHRRDRASFIPEIIEKLQNSGRLVLLDSNTKDQPLGESITFFETNGHTPGQLHLVLKEEDKQLVFCGDLIPGAAWINPSISMGYDRFAELVLDEKQKFFEEHSGNSTLLFFTHDPEICASQYEANGRKILAKNPLKEMSGFSLSSLS